MGAYLSLSIPILALAVAIQSSFVPQIRVLGGGPDLVLLIVLAWSVYSELDESLTWAVVGGILQDLMSAAPTGASALGLVLIVFIVYLLNSQLYHVGLLSLLVLAVVGTVIKETMFAFVLSLVGMGSDYFSMFSYVIAPSAVYNGALIWITYGFVRRIQKRIKRYQTIGRS